jgi:hypothetical protein
MLVIQSEYVWIVIITVITTHKVYLMQDLLTTPKAWKVDNDHCLEYQRETGTHDIFIDPCSITLKSLTIQGSQSAHA